MSSVQKRSSGQASTCSVERALQVVAAARVAPHAAEGEAALVRDVDELVRHRRRVGQEAQPAERIVALEGRQRAGGHALAAHAVEAVAAGDEVARELVLVAAVAVAHDGMAAVEVVHAHVLGLVDRDGAARRARVHQVARDLGLAVDDHALAGESVEVDAVAAAGPADLDAVVHEALGVHARADARFVEQRDRALFEDARADAPEHVLAACAARGSRCRCRRGAAAVPAAGPTGPRR